VPASMTTKEIADLLAGTLSGDPDLVIRGLAGIEHAGPEDLTFVANPKYAKHLQNCRAGAVLVGPGIRRDGGTQIEVENPYLGFVRLLETFYPDEREVRCGIHPTASVSPGAELADDVAVGAMCTIDDGARIGAGTTICPHVHVSRDVRVGAGCLIHSNVSLRRGVRLGDRVVIQNGAVIGSDGFGFAEEEKGFRKIPQVGIVILEDDVEIGANTTIDRATMGVTLIKRGTKIDNLCQIAHNVVIGENCVIAAQTGIAGSTTIGDGCRCGGQVGIVGHLKIGDGAMFGAQSGVSNDVAAGTIVSGSPARPIGKWRRIEAALSRLPELVRRVRHLERRIEVPDPESGERKE